jgi:hypothetical protein
VCHHEPSNARLSIEQRPKPIIFSMSNAPRKLSMDGSVIGRPASNGTMNWLQASAEGFVSDHAVLPHHQNDRPRME